MELVCEPVFDYGEIPATLGAGGRTEPHRGRHRRRRRRCGCTPTCPSASKAGGSGPAAPCGSATGSSARCRGPTAWPDRTTSTTRTRRIDTTVRFWRDWLDTGADPRPPVAQPDPTLGAGDQGSHLHADGRDRRRPHDVVARDARWRAELGLPVQLAARLDVHAAGAALAEPRLGGRRVHAVRRRPRGQRRRRPADHVRDRRPARPDGVDARPPERVRRGASRSGSATAPSTSARTTSSGPPSTRSCCTRAAASASRGGCGRSSRRRPSARRASGASPTRASGRRAASRSTTCRRS